MADSLMRYLPEGCQETDVTDKIFTIEHLNKAIQLIGGKKITRQTSQYQVEGGRIDNIGSTDKKTIWVFEHQDSSGKADQIHTSKLLTYTGGLSQTYDVEGGILFCETVSDYYKKLYETFREQSAKRRRYKFMNLHFVKAQWTDQGEFVPELFDSIQSESIQDSTLDHYADFVDIYAKEWTIQREEINNTGITLWHRIPELPAKYMAYVHILKNSIKVGIHCLKNYNSNDEQFLQSLGLDTWTYRDSAKDRRTLEKELSKDSDPQSWADLTESLKRSVRKTLKNQEVLLG